MSDTEEWVKVMPVASTWFLGKGESEEELVDLKW